jgi:hypothetical protein
MMSFSLITIKLLPWIVLLVIILFARLLLKWAKQQHTGAYVVGAMVQTILPDPYVERTIQVVQHNKKEVKKEKENDGELL